MTQEIVKQYINYNPETGELRRLKCTAKRHKLNELITSKEIAIAGITYQTSALIWLYVYGTWPIGRIIKLDGNSANLAISNLITKDMYTKIELTQETLRNFMDYDQTTGIFRWKLAINSSIVIGSTAGSVTGELPNAGYVTIGLFGKIYRAHRLAWFYVHGYWPIEIDHIDQCRTNNSLINLREVTVLDNMKNKSLYKNNKSGVCGIYKKGNSWVATINGNKNYLGTYQTKEEAIAARQAADKIFMYHVNHGKKPNDYPAMEYIVS